MFSQTSCEVVVVVPAVVVVDVVVVVVEVVVVGSAVVVVVVGSVVVVVGTVVVVVVVGWLLGSQSTPQLFIVSAPSQSASPQQADKRTSVRQARPTLASMQRLSLASTPQPIGWLT